MKKFISTSAVGAFLFSALLISGCSDDGGGVSNAKITADNVELLATAGTEGVKQAVNVASAPTTFGRAAAGSTSSEASVIGLTNKIAQSAAQDPKFETIPDFCSTGTVNITGTENNGTITFTSCDFGGIILNGTATISISSSGSILTSVINYNNFSITIDGVTETIDFNTRCTTNTDTAVTSCTYSSTALGIDGRTYTVTDSDVSGDSISGYTVSATVIDPTYGRITISTTTAVTLGCSNGQPDAGSIVVSDGTNTMTVTFIDCSSFSVDFDGSTTTFNW